MKKQSIDKLNMLLFSIKNRFEENTDTFNGINLNFTSGLKEFKAVGILQGKSIKYNFGGKTEVLSIDRLMENIIKEADTYDSLTLTYMERGTNVIITANNKEVKMSNEAIKENPLEKKEETSTLLNRNYYIKVGEADSLLKELGIMTKEGKIKNTKIRKYNQIDHYVELLQGVLESLPKNTTINILDCGCGKSYLTFVLNYYLTEVKKIKCHFIGLDRSESVIAASKKMSQNLDYRNMEFHAVDINEYKTQKKIHIVLSLHACDTATDMGLALGIRLNSDVIIAVPCCHKELLGQYSYAPFKSLTKHGVFKTRMADILTDSMRSLMLEAKGYSVSVVEYISPLETPKNLMIRAIKTKEENPSALDEYLRLMTALNIYPALYAYLNNEFDADFEEDFDL